MSLSTYRWNPQRTTGLVIGVFMLLGSTSARAEDDWRRGGLEGLRPLTKAEPMVAFLRAQEAQQTEPAETTDPNTASPLLSDQQPLSEQEAQSADQQLQPLPPPEEKGSYDAWLDAAANKGVPRVREGRFVLPSLRAPTIATDKIGNGRTPDGFRYDKPGPIIPLPETSAYRGSESWTPAYWAAANTFSNPRYFEDRMLERHGHERFPALTPMLSGARFFTTIGMLPYLMTVSPPCIEESTLGYYRSGTCAPGLRQRPPIECRAVLVEAAAVAGFVLLIP